MEKECVEFSFLQGQFTYKEFLIFYDKLKTEYSGALKKLKTQRDELLLNFDREKVAELIRDHKKLVNSIVLKVIDLYKPFIGDAQLGIFWSGGFARNTNRFLGDYDLNFVYPESQRALLRPIEEQICLMLSLIFERERDLVHSVIRSHLTLEDFSCGDRQLFFKMNWIDGSREYPISPGLEKLMLKISKSASSADVVKMYLINNLKSDSCPEWLFSYEFVYGINVLENLFSEVYFEESRKIKNHVFLRDFDKLINSQLKAIVKNLKKANTADYHEVSNIKEVYKKNPLDEMFAVLALIRRKLLFVGKNVPRINLEEYSQNPEIKKLLGEKLFEKLFYNMYHYLWNVMRIEYLFEKRGIRFGMHSKEKIESSLEELYKKEYSNSQFSPLNDLNSLYFTLEEVLAKIKFEEEK